MCRKNENLKKVWKKSSYKGFKPHITIYDGNDNEFATQLFNILNNNFKKFFYKVDKLIWLEPKDKN